MLYLNKLTRCRRAQPELYEEPQTPAARHYKRSDSFFNARKHTRKEMEQKYPANQKLLRDTVQKAKDLLRPDKTNAVACKTLAQHFLDLTRRPAQASDPDWKWVLNSYSWLGMMDDWWHVRRLFQALAVYVNDEGFTLHLNGFQVLLAQLLGAIYGGSTDPTPFNMCYEFVLRLMWRRLVEHKRMKESQYVNAFNQSKPPCPLHPSSSTDMVGSHQREMDHCTQHFQRARAVREGYSHQRYRHPLPKAAPQH